MRILAWNCRGLGLTPAVGELRDLVRSNNPSVVFLSETKKKGSAMEHLKWSIGFTKGVAVDCKDRSRGLAVWWRDELDVEMRPYSQYHMDIIIKEGGREWRFSGIYGEPKTELRDKTWGILRYLHAQSDLPWLCAGDFNEIISADEQQGEGERERSLTHMMRFRECLRVCELQDLGFSGYPFTWDNKREGNANVQVRLDRAVGNAALF